MSAQFKPPGQCPVCGEWTPAGAVTCDECGACDKSGWSDGVQTDGLDLPDEDFDYAEFATREFGLRPTRGARQRKLWRLAALLLIAALVLAALAPRCTRL